MQVSVITSAVMPHQIEYQRLGRIACVHECNAIQHGMGYSPIKAVNRLYWAFLFFLSHDCLPDAREIDTCPIARLLRVRQGQHLYQGEQIDCRAFAGVPMFRYSWRTSPCSTYSATLCSLPSSVGRIT